MADRYLRFANSPAGRTLAARLGLPRPVPLERSVPGRPLVAGPVLLGGSGRLGEATREVLERAGADVRGEADRFKALVFDASGIGSSEDLGELYAFFHPVIRRVDRCGRIVVLATPPEACGSPREATAQRAVEGFARSLAKEVGRGATAQLLHVAPGAEALIEAAMRFLLSPRSAYVSGQVVRIGPAEPPPADLNWNRPLAGKTALVTGAARGIGEATASILERDGANVIRLDVPSLIAGAPLALDLTDDDAPARIADHLAGGVDIVIHNAGITRDRTLGRMSGDEWRSVLDVNLAGQERIDDALLQRGLIREGGRIVCVSSLVGLAGNRGQTNYAASKAGVAGRVQALAPVLAQRGVTINGVAPGFIESRMTARMPALVREAGRRMNSLSQGGLPVDVAETIAWLASPGSAGVNGQVVRVCGQALLGP